MPYIQVKVDIWAAKDENPLGWDLIPHTYISVFKDKDSKPEHYGFAKKGNGPGEKDVVRMPGTKNEQKDIHDYETRRFYITDGQW